MGLYALTRSKGHNNQAHGYAPRIPVLQQKKDTFDDIGSITPFDDVYGRYLGITFCTNGVCDNIALLENEVHVCKITVR